MRRNTTQFRNPKTGKPKNPGLKTNRKRTASSLSSDYGMILQIYCLNKKEGTTKKELKYEKLISGKSISATAKPSYSIPAKIVSFFNESLLLLKKIRPGVAMVTE